MKINTVIKDEWRLPTIWELKTLLPESLNNQCECECECECDNDVPQFNLTELEEYKAAFPSQTKSYWSCTDKLSLTNSGAMMAYFCDEKSAVMRASKKGKASVRLIRRSKDANLSFSCNCKSERFTISDCEKFVMDNKTGYYWQRNNAETLITWADAGVFLKNNAFTTIVARPCLTSRVSEEGLFFQLEVLDNKNYWVAEYVDFNFVNASREFNNQKEALLEFDRLRGNLDIHFY